MTPQQGETLSHLSEKARSVFGSCGNAYLPEKRTSTDDSTEFMRKSGGDALGDNFMACFRPCLNSVCSPRSHRNQVSQETVDGQEIYQLSNPMIQSDRMDRGAVDPVPTNPVSEQPIDTPSKTGLRIRACVTPTSKSRVPVTFELREIQASPSKVSLSPQRAHTPRMNVEPAPVSSGSRTSNEIYIPSEIDDSHCDFSVGINGLDFGGADVGTTESAEGEGFFPTDSMIAATDNNVLLQFKSETNDADTESMDFDTREYGGDGRPSSTIGSPPSFTSKSAQDQEAQSVSEMTERGISDDRMETVDEEIDGVFVVDYDLDGTATTTAEALGVEAIASGEAAVEESVRMTVPPKGSAETLAPLRNPFRNDEREDDFVDVGFEVGRNPVSIIEGVKTGEDEDDWHLLV